MSVDRVDVIERSYRAFRDDDVEALLALYHPEAVWDMTHWEGFPDAQAYRGLAGIEEVIRMLRDGRRRGASGRRPHRTVARGQADDGAPLTPPTNTFASPVESYRGTT